MSAISGSKSPRRICTSGSRWQSIVHVTVNSLIRSPASTTAPSGLAPITTCSGVPPTLSVTRQSSPRVISDPMNATVTNATVSMSSASSPRSASTDASTDAVAAAAAARSSGVGSATGCASSTAGSTAGGAALASAELASAGASRTRALNSRKAAASKRKARLKRITAEKLSDCILPLIVAAVTSSLPVSTSSSTCRAQLTVHAGGGAAAAAPGSSVPARRQRSLAAVRVMEKTTPLVPPPSESRNSTSPAQSEPQKA